jgi:hypothetical protein
VGPATRPWSQVIPNGTSLSFTASVGPIRANAPVSLMSLPEQRAITVIGGTIITRASNLAYGHHNGAVGGTSRIVFLGGSIQITGARNASGNSQQAFRNLVNNNTAHTANTSY